MKARAGERRDDEIDSLIPITTLYSSDSSKIDSGSFYRACRSGNANAPNSRLQDGEAWTWIIWRTRRMASFRWFEKNIFRKRLGIICAASLCRNYLNNEIPGIPQ